MINYKIILYTSKTLKLCMHPVVLRVTHDRQRKYYVIKNDAGQNLILPVNQRNGWLKIAGMTKR
jgi:hypothetical protein